MVVKPTAITEEEIPIYEQEETLAQLYERREDEYTKLLERLEEEKKWIRADPTSQVRICLDICEFLLRESQFRKLV